VPIRSPSRNDSSLYVLGAGFSASGVPQVDAAEPDVLALIATAFNCVSSTFWVSADAPPAPAVLVDELDAGRLKGASD
jgi:hypothetical protein